MELKQLNVNNDGQPNPQAMDPAASGRPMANQQQQGALPAHFAAGMQHVAGGGGGNPAELSTAYAAAQQAPNAAVRYSTGPRMTDIAALNSLSPKDLLFNATPQQFGLMRGNAGV